MSPSAQDPAEAGLKTPEHQPERRPERQTNGHSEAHPETHPEATTEMTREMRETRETTETAEADKDKPTSCLGCRRRKLKCSRDHPSCTHCQRLDVTCVYDTKKAKPGMRPGAIEALNQRIEALENALASRGSTASTTPAPESSPSSASVVSILSVLAQELQKFNSASAHAAPAPAPAPAPLQLAAQNGTAVHSISVVSPSSTNSPGTANGHAHSHSHGLEQNHNSRRKRRRMVDSCGNPDIDLARPLEDMAADFEDPSISPGLPPPETLQAVVNAYFLAVQPWIPVLHETQFRRRMHDANQRPRLACILHAMVVAAARYVQPDDLPDDVANDHLDGLLRLAQRSRSHVLLSAMDNLSVESLQALIILAFHDIGSGETTRAWSIVASLTRTVEYLGLADEDEEHQYHERGSQNGQQQSAQNPQQNQQQQTQKPQQQKNQESNSNSTPQPLLCPMTILGPPHNWIEEEERRRVFWCILLLDRFCSVATGWNTGLAAANANRRLPADGYFFYKEEPVLTPYMNGPPAGAPDMALSHPLAHAPNAADRARERETADSPASPHNHGHNGHMNVGAFAYCIEAAESLSRVVSAFLRQSVDFGSRQDVSRWLTRFKELDLRLVHWKMYLPQRWRDSNVSRQPTLVNMDPNLTLAHITHNTSTILLHQSIAYPDPVWWTRIVKLPSFCSAETCQNAAIETATITNKYLRYTSKNSPVASQFAFCVYISARVLLVHWRSDGGETSANGHGNGNGNSVPDDGVLPEFWSLLRSLEDMDRRWIGSVGRLDPNKKSTSLAGHYAQHLKDLHKQCLASPSFVVNVLGYTEFEPKTPKAAPPTATSTRAPSAFVEPAAVQAAPVPVPDPTPTPAPAPTQLPQIPQVHPTWPLQPLDQLSPVMTTYHQHAHAQAQAMADNQAYAAASVVSVPAAHTDDLAAISHLLLDQQFMDRDRVISFEDSFFAAPGRWT